MYWKVLIYNNTQQNSTPEQKMYLLWDHVINSIVNKIQHKDKTIACFNVMLINNTQ